MYYTYMLRCADNSIYTGMTTNIEKRMKEHFDKTKNCAKYTRTHTAQKLEAVWQSESRTLACRLEFHIKKLSKKAKETLIKTHSLSVLSEKIETDKYSCVDIEKHIRELCDYP